MSVPNKTVFWYLIWPILGALVAGWAFNAYHILQTHNQVIAELKAFKSVGKRFTADDGLSHCLDIQELQRIAGVKVRECARKESE
jgi:UDP-2,3-diacylglucosamine pyrophosphatase LpxH